MATTYRMSHISVKPGNLLICQKRTEFCYQLANWQSLPIQENYEPLVQVAKEITYPYYYHQGFTDDPRVFLREQVVEMLLVARESVEKNGMELIILDGWRSVNLQNALFWHYLKEFAEEGSWLAEQLSQATTIGQIESVVLSFNEEIRASIIEANKKYVSLPSADCTKPSPHATGGAVDVWLMKDGQMVDLGVPFDHMEETAGAFYHLADPPKRKLFASDDRVFTNRNILLSAMTEAGFSCYPPEIWHFNMGNQMDSLVTGRPAVYSYIEPD